MVFQNQKIIFMYEIDFSTEAFPHDDCANWTSLDRRMADQRIDTHALKALNLHSGLA